MFGRLGTLCLLVGYFSLCTLAATAQEVVHALTGTVTSMNPGKTIEVDTDDGPEVEFKDFTKSNIPLEFDKDLRAQATSADRFNTKGTQVIVYYFGEGMQRTAVALQGLASGTLKRTIGTVVKFDKHQRLLTVESTPGGVQSFHIDSRTVVETSVGAVGGRRFDPEKGDQVRVTTAPAQGSGTALFIYAK
jgi:hypothetical protein